MEKKNIIIIKEYFKLNHLDMDVDEEEENKEKKYQKREKK